MSVEDEASASADEGSREEPTTGDERGETGTGHPPDDEDGPVDVAAALRGLAGGGGADDEERSEAARAGALADRIVEQLRSETAGTRIGTLALFNDSVSFGGGFRVGGADEGRGGPVRGALAAVRLAETELVGHTERFVAPEGYADAVEALREHHLLLLTGPPGSGREAAAVNLLGEVLAVTGVAGSCHRLLDPGRPLSAGWEPPTEVGAYLALLDEDAPSMSAAPDGERARALTGAAERLRTIGSYLVLVGGQELAMVAPTVSGAAWFAMAPVDPVAILERRVLGEESEAHERARLRELLERSNATLALRERPSAGHAAGLADVISTGGDLDAAVRALRDPSDQVTAWFSRHRAPEQLAFALATAVLEGSRYLTVSDAALALRSMLSPQDECPPDVRYRDRIAVDQPWIELVSPASSGLAAQPAVRFRSPLLRQAVLGYAWTRLDGRRDATLRWLRGLLTHPDVEVRAHAAVAAGMVSWTDLDYALHRFLTPWAASASWPLRQAAATALGVAGSQPETAEPVWALLHEWARSGANRRGHRLAGTAANAAGGWLGRDAPERALRVLRDALDRGEDWGTLTPVAWSGLRLIHRGRAAEVLAAYRTWSQPQDGAPLTARALSAFVFAAGTALPEKDLPEAPPDAVPEVPLLLALAGRFHPLLSTLWARALARSPVQEAALDVLRRWLDDHLPRLPGSAFKEVVALFEEVAATPGSRHRERLLYWLHRWARDGDTPSRNAALLHDALLRASPHG
ncbi:hypothetical protein [Streptomyces triticirhizae]|uniref:Uncharacterized protein n=1 Tax=Streptomyces triticirhizae TaxID=2483353 RepID=A0A3M2LVB5_9ACTN|nr:hypothetical protein [Streptomyces triticirhizae]RMI41439.1 hypothetical protein EBN88_10985 [Streptomyces triticirhizae]